MCNNTSLSFLQKNASSNLGQIIKLFLKRPYVWDLSLECGTNPIHRDSFVRSDQSQTSLAGKYCEIRPMKDGFCKDFIRTGRDDWRAWYISHSTMI